MKSLAGGAVVALSLYLVLGTASPVFAAPVSAVIDGMTFEADDANVAAGAAVTNYLPGPSAVVIPSSVDIAGVIYSVTSIGPDAFQLNGLTSVTIPSGVTSIGSGAFESNSLTSVTIPGTVTSIGPDAFRLNGLTSVTISSGVTTIGAAAFQSNSLTSVTIPSTVTSIGTDAFRINPLASAEFLGLAPTVGTNSFGLGFPTISYRWRFGADQVAGGFTQPWAGYTTQAIAQVAFDTAGGSAAPAQQLVIVGSPVTAPANPTRSGFGFTGWFTQASGGTEWDFAQPLTDANLSTLGLSDLTLVSQWSPALANTGTSTEIPLGLGAVLLFAGFAAIFVRMRITSARTAQSR